MIKASYILLLLAVLASCTTSKIYPVQYYEEHKTLLHETEELYNKATKQQLLAIAFTDLGYNDISLELKTDSVRYIYDFYYEEKRINDTLQKFGYDSSLVNKIIRNMRSIGSTWINTLDYYIDGKKQLLLFVSAPVKQFSPFPLLQKRKYYLYNFYQQPQYYDEKGRLLDKKTIRQLRKVNNEVFWRINEKVCYTISGKFR